MDLEKERKNQNSEGDEKKTGRKGTQKGGDKTIKQMQK